MLTVFSVGGLEESADQLTNQASFPPGEIIHELRSAICLQYWVSTAAMKVKHTKRSEPLPLPRILLRSVLEYADHPAQTSSARVCQVWHEAIISILWDRVDNAGRLVHVFRVNGAQPSIIPDNCWTRFFHYSKHVKELVIGPDGFGNLFDAIIFSMPLNSPHLFPNLSSLYWQSHQPLRLALFFLPPCLSSLSIDHQSTELSPKDVAQFIQAVGERCQCLTYLDYSGPHKDAKSHEIAESISDRKQSSMIRQWKIGPFEFGFTMLDISHAERDWDVDPCGPPFTVFELSYKPNHNPISKYAGLVSNLLDLKRTSIFSCLREVYLKLEQRPAYHMRPWPLPDETPDEDYGLPPLFSELVNSASQIELVVLSSARKSINKHITFELFEPLLQCPLLKTFVIIHPLNVIITDEQLVSLTQAWPQLQHLYLSPVNPFPLPSDDPDLNYIKPPCGWRPLSLRVICSLPIHCPQLQSLGLLVDPRMSCGQACLQPFSQLYHLTLVFIGDSFLEAEIASAIVEATLPSCKILLLPSLTGNPKYPNQPAVERVQAARQIQEDLPFWRDMRNQLLGRIVAA